VAIVDLMVPIEIVKVGRHAAIVDSVGGSLPPSSRIEGGDGSVSGAHKTALDPWLQPRSAGRWSRVRLPSGDSAEPPMLYMLQVGA
jgi:hypothetical protein